MFYADHVLRAREDVAADAPFRERVRWDLVERPPYAFGLLAAADAACFFGVDKIIAIECGVAEGAGLLNLERLAILVAEETQVEIEVIGLDTGQGLPPLEDHRDHPEIWAEGDFPTGCEAPLNESRVIWGNVRETVDPLLLELKAPIGFVSFDLDLFSSTRDALGLYLGSPESALPVSIAYFDDTHGAPDRIGSLLRNRWCGQLRAIDEFNDQNDARKLDVIRTLRARRPLDREMWLDQVFGVHFLDHPLRQVTGQTGNRTIQAHATHPNQAWPL